MHFACLTTDRAAGILQSSWSSSRAPKWGVWSYMEKSCWNSAGACFSLAPSSPYPTQNGSFVSERKKIISGGVVWTPHVVGCEAWTLYSAPAVIEVMQYCSGHLFYPSVPSSINYLIFFELSTYWCRSVHLSSWGYMVHHLVLSEDKTQGLCHNIIYRIIASISIIASDHSVTSMKEQGEVHTSLPQLLLSWLKESISICHMHLFFTTHWLYHAQHFDLFLFENVLFYLVLCSFSNMVIYK